MFERLRGAPPGTGFDFVRGDVLIGTYRRRRPDDDGGAHIYDLRLTHASGELLDRRLALAACVAVDALQGR